tara:strand:+ start:360 stop:710 length:351 start_codon:yes stop_codon:yes gene_type:complete
MKTRTQTHEFQPLHDLKAGRCTTMDRMQILLFLSTRNGSTTQIGHAIGVLPTTASNMLREMSSADNPLVMRLANSVGWYLMTDAGRDAVRAMILLMNQVGHDISSISGELTANLAD